MFQKGEERRGERRGEERRGIVEGKQIEKLQQGIPELEMVWVGKKVR